MVDSLRREAWPRSLRHFRRIHEAMRVRLRQELHGEPTAEDMAAALHVTVKRFEHIEERIRSCEGVSVVAKDEAGAPEWMRRTQTSDNPLGSLLEGESRRVLLRHMAKLPMREAWIVERYYFDEIVMSEIGPELGVNESRVSQLHARALRRLREMLTGAKKGGVDGETVCSV